MLSDLSNALEMDLSAHMDHVHALRGERDRRPEQQLLAILHDRLVVMRERAHVAGI